MSFWERYENLCKERNLSPQSKILMDKIGVTSGTITGWKKGSLPKYDVLARIAAFFQVDIRYLLGLTELKHGEDILEEATDYIIDAGADVEIYEDENGAGREYVVSYNGQSLLLQEHEYNDLCHEIIAEINSAKITVTETIIRDRFTVLLGGKVNHKKPDIPKLTEEEQDLLAKYRQLDQDGKIMLRSALISELRRMG